MYQKESKPWPTMYDLPSEDPEEPGVPDEFHIFQPNLLRNTFYSPSYPEDQIFVGIDINLYYDLNHTKWYKRPDWMAVLGVKRYDKVKDLRLSYVVWDEQVNPTIVIELLSEGTDKEDLGETLRDSNRPPTKWEVYEQILKIPYYVVYDRLGDRFLAFELIKGYYEEIITDEPLIWFEQLQLHLGTWVGEYQKVTGKWLRWYDLEGNLIPLPEEIERQRADTERQRAEKLAAKLRALGIDPEE